MADRDVGRRPRTAKERSRQRYDQARRRSLFGAAGAGAALVLVVFVIQGLQRASHTRVEHPGFDVVVEGAVAQPGPYDLDDVATVCELIERAGGRTDQLAPAFCGVPAERGTRIVAMEDSFEIVPLAPAELFAIGGTLDPNHASVADLTQVPGLSDTLAGRIEMERSEQPFCSLEDLDRVRGIGEHKVVLLRPFLEIANPPEGCPTTR